MSQIPQISQKKANLRRRQINSRLRYAPLINIMKSLINQHKLIQQYNIAIQLLEMKKVRNYANIVLGIGLIKRQLQQKGQKGQKSRQEILKYFQKKLDKELQKIFSDEKICVEFKQKCRKKIINDVMNIFDIIQMEGSDEQQIAKKFIGSLYHERFANGKLMKNSRERLLNSKILIAINYIKSPQFLNESKKVEKSIPTKATIEGLKQQKEFEKDMEEEDNFWNLQNNSSTNAFNIFEKGPKMEKKSSGQISEEMIRSLKIWQETEKEMKEMFIFDPADYDEYRYY